MSNLCGMHDFEALVMTPPDTWIVDTLALADKPAPRAYPASHHWIGRLNWTYDRTGCLPDPGEWPAFADACARYVAGSFGCTRWIIGNEPNLLVNTPPVLPPVYAQVFDLCRHAIRLVRGHEQDEVLLAGPGPWNAQTKYAGNPDGDWCQYLVDCARYADAAAAQRAELAAPNKVQGYEGVALHAYTHGYDPALVVSDATMDPPFSNYHYHFRTYRDQIDALGVYGLSPRNVYITEANGDGPWQAVGLMPAMIEEIDGWNRSGDWPIQCVVFYRYPHYDRYYIDGKPDVVAEYKATVNLNCQSPGAMPLPPIPQPPEPPPPVDNGGGSGEDGLPPRVIDPRLLARGVHFDFVKVAAGQPYWRITETAWHPDAAHTVGPDHHILGNVLREGVEQGGVPLRVDWPSGNTTVTSKANDPNAAYNYDYGMSPSLNEFAIQVADGLPSDRASGIGMGMMGNPNEHTSTWITFEYTISAETRPEPPGDITEGFVTAPAGLHLRDGPGTQYTSLGVLDYGSSVLYDETQGSWHHLVDGWVSADYVGAKPTEVVPPIPQPPDEGDLKLVWPVRNARITQRFGEHYEYYQEHFDALGHNGLDFGLPAGSPIYACADGVVQMAQDDKPGYGLFLRLYHPTVRLGSLYAHCQELLVAEGDQVTQGQQIATVGSSGNSTGPHLHWELCAQNVKGYVNVSYGHSKGRCNPEVVMWLLGSPPVYG